MAWLTLEAVRGWLGLPATADPDDALALVVDAVESLVTAWHGAPADPPAPDIRAGAVMLAARLYRRRNSPEGVQVGADAITYVARNDPDIARLLRIDNFRKPKAR